MAAVGTAAIGSMAAASMSFEDAFANVRKTVDASEAEFRQLEQSLRQMSTQTRTSASDLALIMSTAGQLGVRGVDNLTKFTRTIDMLQVATNIVGQEGAQALAQFMNIMQENLGNVDRVGAAITELGNNFAATEADILNMAQRLAGAGKTIGLTTADVLGLATALSAVGIRAEMGGSALSRVLINMSQAVEMQDERLREFARTAGMSAREFADTFRRDPVRALQAFIEGLRRLDSEGKNVFVTLENVGASEIRVRDTLLRLFQASDLLADAVERSNRAWEENIALTEEFERFMGTGVARLRMMWNTIVEVARIVGDVYNPIIKQAADFTQGVADALRRMTPEQQQAIAEFGALATAVLGGIAAFLLAIKTIMTFATGLTLLTRAVVFFLSPWTLLTMAVIAAAIAIATKWDEIRETIAQTDLGKAAIEAWENLKKVWQSDELTLPEKIIESVRITVRFVTGLIESIMQWWLGASIKLARRGAELLGLDPDNAWLPAFLTRLDEIWKNEDLTFSQKIVKSVVITVESVLGLVDSIISWWLAKRFCWHERR
jgi:phage tail tape measure protein, TP901 family, core region